MTDQTARPLDLDVALEGWFRDGTRLSADRVVAAALTEVGTVRQHRPSQFSVDGTVFRLGLVAATMAALAIGLGLGLGLRLPGGVPSPSPSEVGSPAIPPAGMVLYSNAEDGYELTLPATWTPHEFFNDPPGTMLFGGAHTHEGASSFGALTVSIGSTNGTVYACAPSLCRPIVATTIDELDAAITSGSAADAGQGITTTDADVALDGEPARLEYVTFSSGLIEAGAQFHHVFAVHDGRPVVLSFDKYAYDIGQPSNEIGWVESLIQGFRFLDPAPSDDASPTPSGTAWRVVTDVANGYALEVPAGWEDRECCSPGGRTLYAGEATPVLIMAGDVDGTVTICQRGDCAVTLATSLSDLRHAVEAVDPMDGGLWKHSLRHLPMLLGGEPAEREWADSTFLAGPVVYSWVYAIHDGRPFVLRFSHFNLNPAELQRIVESFAFLD